MKNKYFLLLEWEVSYLELEFNDVKNITYLRDINTLRIYAHLEPLSNSFNINLPLLDGKQCIRYFHGVCLF